MAVPVNCHIHLPPNFSAFATLSDAVDQAAGEGIRVLGASNYYDHGVYKQFSHLCKEKGILPLEGIEIVCWHQEYAEKGWKINDPGNPGKVYLCGKSLRRLDAPSSRATEILHQIRNCDQERTRAMTLRLREICHEGCVELEFSAEKIEAQVAAEAGVDSSQVVLQERHLAQALQEKLFETLCPESRRDAMARVFNAVPKSPNDPLVVQNEIRSHLMKAGKPGYVGEKFISFSTAKELIQELDGIACYPVVIDGMNPISEFELTPSSLAENLQSWGIGHAEFIPNRNSPEALEDAVRVLTEAGITVSAGTEHNTKEPLSLKPLCRGGEPLPSFCDQAFYFGAKKLAAWQNPDYVSLLESYER